MVPIRLNLMPYEKRKRIDNLMRYLFLKHLLQILILVLCLSGMALLTGRYILEQNFINLAMNIISVSKETGQINREIKNANEKIILVSAAQINFVPWSKVIIDTASATPPGIVWSSWNFDKKTGVDGASSIVGVAQNREDLLKLAENLKGVPWITTVDLPLDALVKIGTEPFNIKLVFDSKKIY